MLRFQSWFIATLLAAVAALPAQSADLRDKTALEAFVDGVVTPLMQNENSPSGTVAIVLD